MSRPRSSYSPFHDLHSKGLPWLERPDYTSRNTSKSDATSDSSIPLDSRSKSESLLGKAGAPDFSPKSTRASTSSLRSDLSSKPLLRARSSSGASRPGSSRTLPTSEQRPGKIWNLGIFGLYHHNPNGLAGFYDWDAEDGGYVPFQHQRAHRKTWRQEMRKAQEEEQRERAVKLHSLEKMKAARRRAYEEYLATKSNAST